MTEKPAVWPKLINSYAELYKHEHNGDFERALKVCNKILHNCPGEQVAFTCKVVCFIQLSKFEEATHFMKGNPFSKDLNFEKAYCLYRSNKSQEALDIINALEEQTPAVNELKAQILYRLEKFSESFKIYKEISNVADDDYTDERATNMAAALIYSDDNLKNKHSEGIREDTYELCFNKASFLVSQGQYAEAERKLRQCEKLCRDALEEDGLSEEEIQLELAAVKIQLGYVFQKQGRIREAQQLYVANLKLKLEDIALQAVASHNTIIINKDQNVFDSKRKIKIISNEMLNHKLMLKQRKLMYLNRAMFNYYTNQFDTCIKLCESIDSLWPDMRMYTAIIKALIFVKDNKYDEALNVLEKCQAESDDEKLQLRLASAHLRLMQGDRLRACDIFKNTGLNRYRPGIVGALITLYSAEGKEDIAQRIYQETVEWYKVNKKTEGDLTNLWRQAAEFHIRNGQPEVAAHSLEELLRINPNDKRAIAQLILAYSECDKEKAISLSKGLFTDEELYEGLDLDTVESSVWLSTKKVPASNSPAVNATPSDNVDKKKKHRKRKGKLPKNYDPNCDPDPERWLPKYERSAYRRKRDRRAKEVIKGSQGTASGQAELFDFSGKIPNETEQHEAASVEPSPAGKHQPKNKGQKKKNKRR